MKSASEIKAFLTAHPTLSPELRTILEHSASDEYQASCKRSTMLERKVMVKWGAFWAAAGLLFSIFFIAYFFPNPRPGHFDVHQIFLNTLAIILNTGISGVCGAFFGKVRALRCSD